MISTFILSFLIRTAFAYKSKNIYLIVFIITSSALFNAPVKPLMDSAVLDLLQNKNDYGKARFFGQVGFGIGSYSVNKFVHSAKKIHNIFGIHFLLSLPTILLMIVFNSSSSSSNLSSPKVAQEISHKRTTFSVIQEAFSNTEVVVFFLLIFFIGVSSGIIENFCIVRMAEISNKSNKSVLGLSRLLSSISGGPMFWLSGSIIQRLGIDMVLTLSLSSYFIRFMTYAYMTSPVSHLNHHLLRFEYCTFPWRY